MKNLLGIIVVIFLPIFTISCSTEVEVYVANSIDGDTFADERDNRYRLFGVDTPEYEWLEEGEEYTNALRQLYAEEASNTTRSLIQDKVITVDMIEKDNYDRTISKWVIDDIDIGLHLLELGLARVQYISSTPGDYYYTDDHSYYEELLLAQKMAYDNQVGIWEDYDNFKEIFD